MDPEITPAAANPTTDNPPQQQPAQAQPGATSPETVEEPTIKRGNTAKLLERAERQRLEEQNNQARQRDTAPAATAPDNKENPANPTVSPTTNGGVADEGGASTAGGVVPQEGQPSSPAAAIATTTTEAEDIATLKRELAELRQQEELRQAAVLTAGQQQELNQLNQQVEAQKASYSDISTEYEEAKAAMKAAYDSQDLEAYNLSLSQAQKLYNQGLVAHQSLALLEKLRSEKETGYRAEYQTRLAQEMEAAVARRLKPLGLTIADLKAAKPDVNTRNVFSLNEAVHAATTALKDREAAEKLAKAEDRAKKAETDMLEVRKRFDKFNPGGQPFTEGGTGGGQAPIGIKRGNFSRLFDQAEKAGQI
jgi:predicted transglutaminase-like cysteine proteinase